MDKYSPGPWHIDGGTGKKGELFVWTDRDEKGRGYLGTHEVCIATVHTRLFEEGQDLACVEEGIEANARLIAAAPELLEALKETLRASPMGPHVKKAQAAIAKATTLRFPELV
jgi:hypothetical protein